MTKLIIAFLLFNNICIAQQQLHGIIKDRLSNKGIPFANISLKSKAIGTYTNEDGLFELKVNAEDMNDSLLIGCLGYDKVTVSINEAKQKNNISLSPIDYKLPEVTITPNHNSKIRNMELGYLKGKPYSRTAGNINGLYTLTAIFVENPNLDNAFIKELIYSFDPKYQEGDAIIKVHLFEKDQYSTSLQPGRELIPENLIITVKSKTKLLKVDIQKFNIRMPYNGVFVGFEWIKGNILQKHLEVFNFSGIAPVYVGTIVSKPEPTFRRYMEHKWQSTNITSWDKHYYVPKFGLTVLYEEDKD